MRIRRGKSSCCCFEPEFSVQTPLRVLVGSSIRSPSTSRLTDVRQLRNSITALQPWTCLRSSSRSMPAGRKYAVCHEIAVTLNHTYFRSPSPGHLEIPGPSFRFQLFTPCTMNDVGRFRRTSQSKPSSTTSTGITCLHKCRIGWPPLRLNMI